MWAYLEVTNVDVCDIIQQLVPQRMDWCGLLSVVFSVLFSVIGSVSCGLSDSLVGRWRGLSRKYLDKGTFFTKNAPEFFHKVFAHASFKQNVEKVGASSWRVADHIFKSRLSCAFIHARAACRMLITCDAVPIARRNRSGC